MKKAIYLENLGCAKNQVDGEALVSHLLDTGWVLVSDAAEADYLIVNTCGFIESAKKESLDTALALNKAHPDKRIILAGCLAQRYGNELFEALPEVDGVFGNRDLVRIDELLRTLKTKKRGILLPGSDGELPSRRINLAPPGAVYVKIAEGCDNRCSYCAIPLIRGGLRSRRPESVAEEIRGYVEAGVVEINLVAQDLGQYGGDLSGKPLLPELLRNISALPGRFWLRLLYIHPEHFPAEIFELCGRDSRILPYFDIPFQHAAPEILKAMGRTRSMEKNLELLASIRSALPEAVLRTTFLTGFPGEGEEAFQALLDFQDAAKVDWLGVFTYSPEEDTPAERLHRKRALKVPKAVAAERKRLLETRQVPLTEANLDRFTGREMDVLIEEYVQGEKLSLGRCYAMAPEVDGLVVVRGTSTAPGSLGRMRIIRRNGFDLEAVPLQ